MKTEKLNKKIEKLKIKNEIRVEKMKNEIYEICEELDYKNSSRFSYNIDRIELFLKELKEFKISEI